MGFVTMLLCFIFGGFLAETHGILVPDWDGATTPALGEEVLTVTL